MRSGIFPVRIVLRTGVLQMAKAPKQWINKGVADRAYSLSRFIQPEASPLWAGLTVSGVHTSPVSPEAVGKKTK